MPFATVLAAEIAAASAGAAMAETMAVAALADVGMGASTSLLGAGETAAGLGLTGMGGLSGAGAGGVASLPNALTSILPQVGGVNPEIAAQVADFANVGAVPPVAPPAAVPSALPSVAGSAMPTTAPPVSQGIQGLQAGNFAQPIPAEYQTAISQVGQMGRYPGTQLASVGNAGVADALSQGANNLPIDPQAYDLGQSQIADMYGKNLVGAETPTPAGNFMNEAEPGWTSSTGPVADAVKPGFNNPVSQFYNWYKEQDAPTRYGIGALGTSQAAKLLNKQPGVAGAPAYNGPLSKFKYSPDTYRPYTYKPYAAGGTVEHMSNENAIGANTGYPQADIHQGAYATPWQTPISRNVVADSGDVGVDQMTGLPRMARGGIAHFEGGGEASGGGDAGSGAAAGGAGDTGGLASLAYSPSMYSPMMYSPAMMSTSLVDPAAAYQAAQPAIDMSRQNFQNFLAQYQNLPITEAAPEPVVYQGLYAGEGPKAAKSEPEWGGYSGASGGSVSPAGFDNGGGISSLGSYSDGGRLLKGPGDGMSDNIPATIGRKQPARLADGEFVVPADVVSGLGNGSTDAGAKHLYSMMDKVRSARTGTKKQGKQINARKYLPA